MSRQILVIRGGAIGDFVLTLPVYSALRTAYPESRIETIACPRIASIAVASGLADAIRPIESRGLAGFFADGSILDPEWAEYFSRFDLILSYLFDPQGQFFQNIQRCTKGRIVVGPHRPSSASQHHAVRQMLEPLGNLFPVNLQMRPSIQLDSCRGPDVDVPHLMMHPGSGNPAKNWPTENWCALARWLSTETDWRFTLFAGEAEGWQVDRIHALLPASKSSLARNWPLPEVARTLSRTTLFIGHDSGITHLAASCGVPVLALWGPTNPEVWAPTGPNVKLLQNPMGLMNLAVSTVAETVKSLVAENFAKNTFAPG